MPSQTRTMLGVVFIALAAMLAAAFLLTAIFGPSDNGLRCSRSTGTARCEVRQTRFFGLYSNTTFAIPETSIRSAGVACPTTHTAGRGSASCNVDLILDSGQNYPVLSYAVAPQAEASARKLNRYFSDSSMKSIEIGQDLLTPLLLFAGVPILFVSLILALRWRLRSGHPSA